VIQRELIFNLLTGLEIELMDVLCDESEHSAPRLLYYYAEYCKIDNE
jgi:hypothetical protein